MLSPLAERSSCEQFVSMTAFVSAAIRGIAAGNASWHKHLTQMETYAPINLENMQGLIKGDR